MRKRWQEKCVSVHWFVRQSLKAWSLKNEKSDYICLSHHADFASHRFSRVWKWVKSSDTFLWPRQQIAIHTKEVHQFSHLEEAQILVTIDYSQIKSIVHKSDGNMDNSLNKEICTTMEISDLFIVSSKSICSLQPKSASDQILVSAKCIFTFWKRLVFPWTASSRLITVRMSVAWKKNVLCFIAKKVLILWEIFVYGLEW